MFTHWKPKLAVFGGLLGWLFTLLEFFGVNAETLGRTMTAHYLLLVATLVFFGIFLTGIYFWFKSARITPENVHLRIRQWLDTFNIGHRVVSWDAWHFRVDVVMQGTTIFVGRPKEFGGRYLLLEVRGFGVLPEHRAAFDALTGEEKARFYRELILEIARARILHSADDDLSNVSVFKQLPITAKLNEADFISSLLEVSQSAAVIWNTISLRLSDKPKLKQPSLVVDTEASPPAPTS